MILVYPIISRAVPLITRYARPPLGYSNQCFPQTATEERGYNYFDNYDFDYDGNPDYTKQDQGSTNEATAVNLTYGLATGSKTKYWAAAHRVPGLLM
ncbi:MAG: hypothetical protein IPN43_11035 [Chitinophagaceae bacterium]|nr:hypothetical protein [Chitinophagaceae bacterium]